MAAAGGPALKTLPERASAAQATQLPSCALPTHATTAVICGNSEWLSGGPPKPANNGCCCTNYNTSQLPSCAVPQNTPQKPTDGVLSCDKAWQNCWIMKAGEHRDRTPAHRCTSQKHTSTHVQTVATAVAPLQVAAAAATLNNRQPSAPAASAPKSFPVCHSSKAIVESLYVEDLSTPAHAGAKFCCPLPAYMPTPEGRHGQQLPYTTVAAVWCTRMSSLLGQQGPSARKPADETSKCLHRRWDCGAMQNRKTGTARCSTMHQFHTPLPPYPDPCETRETSAVTRHRAWQLAHQLAALSAPTHQHPGQLGAAAPLTCRTKGSSVRTRPQQIN